MPLIATRGAASAQGFGEFAQTTAPVYIEDVFSTYLYTGNSSTQTITNNIDLSTDGGLVWLKSRSTADDNSLFDTLRGTSSLLRSNLTNAELTGTAYLSSYNSNGFGLNAGSALTNASGETYVSWTFRKAKKFFDVVTYTGNGTAGRAISHNLGSTPGCVIVKATDLTQNWTVYHRSVGGTKALVLNSTAAADTDISYWNNSDPTSTTFIVGGNGGSTNNNGTNYVAYLFAHDAGGFGTSGSDNVISCGSYTGNGSASGPTVTLGYEPQWILIKRATGGVADWNLVDNMRGLPLGSVDSRLFPNSNVAENNVIDFVSISATGFQIVNSSSTINNGSDTYIYIAIRRGPMKTPTSGTSVFTPVAYTGNGTARTTVTDIVTDLSIIKRRNTAYNPSFEDRLRGANQVLESNTNAAEIATAQYILGFDVQNGVRIGTDVGVNESSSTFINWAFSRAPGFFDVVCYTGTSANRTLNHNLGVAPELIIQKSRAPDPGVVANYWLVGTNFGASNYRRNWLQLTDAGTTYTYAAGAGFYSQPTSTTFGITDNYNASGTTYVVYLFATLAGVSKVGSYTGSTSVQTINCGFTNGARFVLIKRTDAAGNWIVYDSARGIVAGNDPYLLLNKSDAEDGGDDDLEADSSGFIVNPTPDGISNPGINGATYIFLAIA